MSAPERFLTTLCYTDEPAWTARAEMLDRRAMSAPALVRAILRGARRHRTVALDGSSHVDQLAAVVLTRRGRPPRIVMTDATWGRGTWWLDRCVNRAGIRAMDGPHVTYGVLSSGERERFPRTWGVERERVVFLPFCFTLPGAELDRPTRDDGPVFAGGDSFRDYEPLVAAARGVAAEVVVASALLDGRGDLPPNVRAGRVSHDAFMDAMRAASIVVVPLPGDAERSSGQQTYLNAMAMGKLVVVTDGVGVRDYVEDGQTGLVVPAGDADALRAALAWALDEANAEAVQAIREHARRTARAEFSRGRYVEHVLAVVDG